MDNVGIIERIVTAGDIAALSPEDRVKYYWALCERLGLDPITRPFEYLRLNGRLVLYARRDATDQLRRKHGVTVEITSRERVDDVYCVTARASLPDGRQDEAIGAVSIVKPVYDRIGGRAEQRIVGWEPMRGDELANAIMKAETKAKRRVTLSLLGLGMLDETEIETISDAQVVPHEEVEPPQNGRALPDAGAKAHAPWTAVQEYVERFWAYCEKNNVSREEALSALGVKDISEFDGSASAAKEIIDEYIAWRAGANGEDGE